MKSYLITIKNNCPSYTSQVELRRALAIAREAWPLADWHSFDACELDSIHRLHLHTMVKFPTNISCRFYSEKYNHPWASFHIHFQPVSKGDEDRVLDYINKNAQCQDINEEKSFEYWTKISFNKIRRV